MGRKERYSPEAWKRELERNRIAKRKKWIEDKEFAAKHILKTKDWYLKNREANLAYQKRWREERKLELSEKRKKWRRDNPTLARAKDRKNTEHTFGFYVAECRRGNITVAELSERMHQSLTRFNEKLKKQP